MEQLTHQQKLNELKKCKKDPIYFLCNYIKVVHPIRGLVPFELYPFQKKIIRNIQGNRFNVLRKFRQAGCTTIASAYSLWVTTFQTYQTVVILSKGDTESTEVLDRIKIMYTELPSWMKRTITTENMHVMKFNNGSIIKSRPSGKQSGRSLSGSLLIIDEAAFIDHIDTIWAAVYPVLSTGGKAFVLSTVNGMGNWFYTLYNDARKKKNAFNAIDIKWKEHPEYFRIPGYEDLYHDMALREPAVEIDEWEQITRSNISHKKWLQEYECEFLGTGDTFLEGSLLTFLNKDINEEYYTKYRDYMRIWKDPIPYHDYVLSVDVSLGRDRDYSAFQIIDVYNGEQVAEFYSNKTPINEFANIIRQEGNLYNLASVIIERNNIGNNLIFHLFDTYEYENMWVDDKMDMGFQVTAKNRDQILAKLEEAVRTNTIKINSKRTISELNTFIISDSGKYQADIGQHDDLVMSLALGVHGMEDLLESSPAGYHRQSSGELEEPLAPMVARTLTVMGTEVDEDLRWLIN